MARPSSDVGDLLRAWITKRISCHRRPDHLPGSRQCGSRPACIRHGCRHPAMGLRGPPASSAFARRARAPMRMRARGWHPPRRCGDQRTPHDASAQCREDQVAAHAPARASVQAPGSAADRGRRTVPGPHHDAAGRERSRPALGASGHPGRGIPDACPPAVAEMTVRRVPAERVVRRASPASWPTSGREIVVAFPRKQPRPRTALRA